MSHYDTLGVARDATEAEIRRAFRKKASECHPDRHHHDPELKAANDARMSAINGAYTVLRDPERRAHYDVTGQDEVEEDPIEAKAGELLMTTFRAAIDEDGDMVMFVTARLRAAKAETESTLSGLRLQQRNVAKKRDKIKVKRGENMVQAMIDKKLEHLTADIEANALGVQALTRALELVDNYVWEDPDDKKTAMQALWTQQQRDLANVQLLTGIFAGGPGAGRRF